MPTLAWPWNCRLFFFEPRVGGLKLRCACRVDFEDDAVIVGD